MPTPSYSHSKLVFIMAPRSESATCLACGKKIGKSDYSVQCTLCGLWIHKTCARMTEELFNMIKYQVKQTGRTYWACRSCTNYAEGMHHRMKQIEEKLAEVKQSCSNNEEGLTQVQAEVDRLAEKVEEQAKIASEFTNIKEDSVYEEIHEREMRRANAVIHGMKEAPPDFKGRERQRQLLEPVQGPQARHAQGLHKVCEESG